PRSRRSAADRRVRGTYHALALRSSAGPASLHTARSLRRAGQSAVVPGARSADDRLRPSRASDLAPSRRPSSLSPGSNLAQTRSPASAAFPLRICREQRSPLGPGPARAVDREFLWSRPLRAGAPGEVGEEVRRSVPAGDEGLGVGAGDGLESPEAGLSVPQGRDPSPGCRRRPAVVPAAPVAAGRAPADLVRCDFPGKEGPGVPSGGGSPSAEEGGAARARARGRPAAQARRPGDCKRGVE